MAYVSSGQMHGTTTSRASGDKCKLLLQYCPPVTAAQCAVSCCGCLPSRNRRYKDAALVFAVHACSANTAGPEAQGGHDHEGASRARARARVVRALAESTWAQPRRRAATVHGRSRQHAECYRAVFISFSSFA